MKNDHFKEIFDKVAWEKKDKPWVIEKLTQCHVTRSANQRARFTSRDARSVVVILLEW